MSKLISISVELIEQLDRLRDDCGSEVGKAPYSYVIKKALKRSNMWKK